MIALLILNRGADLVEKDCESEALYCRRRLSLSCKERIRSFPPPPPPPDEDEAEVYEDGISGIGGNSESFGSSLESFESRAMTSS